MDSFSLSLFFPRADEGSVKPPGQLAPQLLLGLSEGVKDALRICRNSVLRVLRQQQNHNVQVFPRYTVSDFSSFVGTP